jgi:CRP/FNR family cyclic AMP-dependent transcriptional regulator
MTALQKKLLLKAGEHVFEEGDKGESMFLVNEGKVQIHRNSSNGRVVLATLGEGDFFGEMAIVHNTKRTATATAMTDTNLMEVPASQLEQLMATNPEFGARMIRELVHRLWDTSDDLVGEREKLGIVLATERIING